MHLGPILIINSNMCNVLVVKNLDWFLDYIKNVIFQIKVKKQF